VCAGTSPHLLAFLLLCSIGLSVLLPESCQRSCSP
jgi:hypothetical protein